MWLVADGHVAHQPRRALFLDAESEQVAKEALVGGPASVYHHHIPRLDRLDGLIGVAGEERARLVGEGL
jgi:hypothetical protein